MKNEKLFKTYSKALRNPFVYLVCKYFNLVNMFLIKKLANNLKKYANMEVDE